MIIDLTEAKFTREESPQLTFKISDFNEFEFAKGFYETFLDAQPIVDELVAQGYWTTTTVSDNCTTYWCFT